ncbi:hypothetical protein HKD37_14G041051 [Glycine soja]
MVGIVHLFYKGRYAFNFPRTSSNDLESPVTMLERCHVYTLITVLMRGQRQKKKNNNGFVVVGCAKWDLEADMKPQEDEEKGRSGMATFRHKCGERKGVVELLECLEREAIMGEDVGKEPSDYNRRAQIFDRSSQVFQALKQLNNDVFPESSQ